MWYEVYLVEIVVQKVLIKYINDMFLIYKIQYLRTPYAST